MHPRLKNTKPITHSVWRPRCKETLCIFFKKKTKWFEKQGNAVYFFCFGSSSAPRGLPPSTSSFPFLLLVAKQENQEYAARVALGARKRSVCLFFCLGCKETLRIFFFLCFFFAWEAQVLPAASPPAPPSSFSPFLLPPPSPPLRPAWLCLAERGIRLKNVRPCGQIRTCGFRDL